jgi:hypothetical protein
VLRFGEDRHAQLVVFGMTLRDSRDNGVERHGRHYAGSSFFGFMGIMWSCPASSCSAAVSCLVPASQRNSHPTTSCAGPVSLGDRQRALVMLTVTLRERRAARCAAEWSDVIDQMSGSAPRRR